MCRLIVCALGGLMVMASFSCATRVEPSWPRFSWDTVPVFYHSCNFTGDYTDDALKIITKFPMVSRLQVQAV